MDHETIESLLAVAALDALDSREASAVEAHLRQCPKCRSEMQAYRETAAMLGNSGERAPEDIWERIAGALEDKPPELDISLLRRQIRGPSNRLRVRLALGAAALVAAVIGVMGFEIASLNGSVDQLSAALPSSQLSQQVAGALANPRSLRAQLSSATTGQTAEVVVLPNGQGYLVSDKLSPLPPGRTYQLWGIAGSTKISLGLLGRQPFEAAFAVAGGARFSELAVTAERAGGVAVSHNPAVVWGALS